ncbi:serine hydrolase [Paenibacillus sp. CF384]|uniref:serine hydrolase domain-containing protein n=1 Tax=Paenibacillus sp. CF384 TaxID=1884382 RepID=UPI000895C78A|nr:serine hydrolase domain-containing protein [Paenibacillus sp. CF384]SDW77036.1 CubicO group peptidase, beta-lactamase class C family [Paenibacillus sp. CF384]
MEDQAIGREKYRELSPPGRGSVSAFLQSELARGMVTGYSVAVLKQGRVVFNECGGRIALPSDAAGVTAATRFNIGSVTKPITGALVLKLAEMGVMSLHDEVKRYVPEFHFGNITLHHLLTHTAGYDGANFIDWPQSGDREAYLQRIYAVDCLKYEPGSANEYYTHGYSILMDVLERATGCSIETFARSHLFDPLGMSATSYEASFDPQFPKQALCAKAIDSLPLHSDTMAPEKHLANHAVTGDSGIYSTAEDLLRFADMMMRRGYQGGKRIFAPATIDLMLRESTNGRFGRTPIFWKKTELDMHGTTNVDVHRCFGDLNSPFAVGHNGFSGCMLVIDPLYDVACAIVTNSRRLHNDGRNYKRWLNVLLAAEFSNKEA